MKLSVRVRGDWVAVPCKGNDKIAWFGEEALRRYYKAKNVEFQSEKVFEVRKAKGGAILDKDDAIKDVLDDNDFVTVGKGLELAPLKYKCLVHPVEQLNADSFESPFI